MESSQKKQLNFKGTTTNIVSNIATSVQPSPVENITASTTTPEKRKDPPTSSSSKKRNENYYQLKEYLESDYGHGEEINRKTVANLSFEALYEDSNKKNDKLAEIKKEDKTLSKTELDSMEHQIPEVEQYLNKRNGDIIQLKHKMQSTSKVARSKKQHYHISIEIPKKSFVKNDISNELNHLRFLKQDDDNDNNNKNSNSNDVVPVLSQSSELMTLNRYDSIENYMENRLFRVALSSSPSITFEQLIMEMRRFGGTDLFEFKFKNEDIIQFVFPVDDFDVFYCCIECKIANGGNNVKIPDYFTSPIGKIFVWKELRILQGEKHINQAITTMQGLHMTLVQRYYFHCGCDLI